MLFVLHWQGLKWDTCLLAFWFTRSIFKCNCKQKLLLANIAIFQECCYLKLCHLYKTRISISPLQGLFLRLDFFKVWHTLQICGFTQRSFPPHLWMHLHGCAGLHTKGCICLSAHKSHSLPPGYHVYFNCTFPIFRNICGPLILIMSGRGDVTCWWRV